MEPELAKALARLKTSADRLNTLCDQAAANVRAIEAYLSDECRVGITCEIVVEHSDDDDNPFALKLAYGRWADKFRVFLSWNHFRYPEADESKPWTECSRDEKLKTIEFLPTLVQKIAEETEARISRAASALAVLDKAIPPVVTSAKPKGGVKNA
ncbi:MAG: hypothetical protein SH850_04420 [Planctomycetaceae bacterium]|nr:hypothetical protein [Planctomycetaceae bacterium]